MCILGPLEAMDLDPFFRHSLFDATGDCPDLAVGSPGAEDKEIAEIRNLAHIKDNDVLCFSLRDEISGQLS